MKGIQLLVNLKTTKNFLVLHRLCEIADFRKETDAADALIAALNT